MTASTDIHQLNPLYFLYCFCFCKKKVSIAPASQIQFALQVSKSSSFQREFQRESFRGRILNKHFDAKRFKVERGRSKPGAKQEQTQVQCQGKSDFIFFFTVLPSLPGQSEYKYQ